MMRLWRYFGFGGGGRIGMIKNVKNGTVLEKNEYLCGKEDESDLYSCFSSVRKGVKLLQLTY